MRCGEYPLTSQPYAWPPPRPTTQRTPITPHPLCLAYPKPMQQSVGCCDGGGDQEHRAPQSGPLRCLQPRACMMFPASQHSPHVNRLVPTLPPAATTRSFACSTLLAQMQVAILLCRLFVHLNTIAAPHQFAGHTSDIKKVFWSPKDSTFLSISEDKSIRCVACIIVTSYLITPLQPVGCARPDCRASGHAGCCHHQRQCVERQLRAGMRTRQDGLLPQLL